ncbi:hypothetical protein EC174900_2046 [Escherichia coli 174900]|nr:hypothetical protein EC174900_2046 [Escherichia coli 174900]
MHNLFTEYLSKTILVKRQYALHSFAPPTLATDYVQTPVIAAYFSVW